MNANYFFIDGSALLAQIRQLRRSFPEYRDKKLCPKRLLTHFMRTLFDLHGASYKRATFYFPTGDDANVGEHIDVPDHATPGVIRDLHFKYCGHKLKKSVEFDKFVEEHVPTKFQGRFAKSEKGIDIEICCDALRLASSSKLERLFILTNDGDFIPLCRTLKEFGSNISIIHLSSVTPPNLDLLREVDSYDVVPFESLGQVFVGVEVEQAQPDLLAGSVDPATEGSADLAVVSEKPDAEPSDLMAIDSEAVEQSMEGPRPQ